MNSAGMTCGNCTSAKSDGSATAMIDPEHVQIQIPTDFQMPPGGLHIRWPDHALEQEARLFDYKWYAALAYVRANKLNHNVIATPHDRFGIIASGKAFNDTRQALADLGLDDDTCRQLGIRLHKVNVVWPLEATITRDFATGLQEILVVEEKRQVIEYQLKEELYNWRADVRPNVLGKFDEPEGDFSGGEWAQPNPSGNWLLRANADLSPAIIARAIAQRLKKLGLDGDMTARIDAVIAKAREVVGDGPVYLSFDVDAIDQTDIAYDIPASPQELLRVRQAKCIAQEADGNVGGRKHQREQRFGSAIVRAVTNDQPLIVVVDHLDGAGQARGDVEISHLVVAPDGRLYHMSVERYEEMQYGGQDRELGERLVNLGIKGKQIRYSAVCVHLDHKRGYNTPESIRKNRTIRQQTRHQRKVWTRYGIINSTLEAA